MTKSFKWNTRVYKTAHNKQFIRNPFSGGESQRSLFFWRGKRAIGLCEGDCVEEEVPLDQTSHNTNREAVWIQVGTV